MAIKKPGLGILALLSVLVIAGVVLAAHEVTPDSGEVGDAVIITLDTAAASETFDITFSGNDDFTETITTDADGNGTKEVTVPEALAGDYNFTINTVPETNLIFTVDNTKPVVGTLDSAKAIVDKAYTGYISFTDANGDEIADCEIVSGGPSSGNLKTTPHTDNKKCKLYFDTTDSKPTSADAGAYTLKFRLKDDAPTGAAWSVEKDISFTVADFLEITGVEIDDKTGDDEDHMPGDEIELTITIVNNGNDDIRDVGVEIDNNKLDIDESLTEFNLDHGEDNDVTFTFTIPYDTDEDTYTIKVDASGEDEDSPHTKRTAETYSVDLKVKRDKHKLIIENTKLDNAKSTCGDDAKLSFKVTNIGREDESVTVTIKNTYLGIDIEVLDFELNSGQSKSFDETIAIPSNAYDDSFTFTILAKSSNTEDSETVSLTLEDCDADLVKTDVDSVSVGPGGEAVVVLSIENIGTIKQTFKLGVDGVDSFGTYNISVDDEDKIEIEAGKTKEITLTLNINKDAELKSYDVVVDVALGGDKIASKTILVTVAKTSWLTGFSVFGGDGADAGLSIGILLAIAFIGYLAYQIWFKKPKTDNLDELEKDEDKGSIIFEDDDNTDKKRGKKK